MTDRELLENAAKAAGLTAEWHEGCSELCVPSEWGHTPARRSGDFRIWNPIADDGDALRLAVKLGIVIDVGSVAAHAYKDGPGVVEIYGSDPYSATRRAIVRAAAAIGAAK